ncbi:hypothetical protein QEO94_07570 [Kingella negevensis]|uniref:hypothetical protein n=1 Tax=Kingella negevensis TaxID=1522312 RepID=UPI002542D021|nr:hypothetical protein [Kingella negevensis]WII92500.1 hypothetical protein QEO94_07570 [Kingella negevensis]
MISYHIFQVGEKWAVYTTLCKEFVGYYTRKDSAIRKVKALIQKQGGLHCFEVVQNNVSRFFRNDEQFNYSEFDYHAFQEELFEEEYAEECESRIFQRIQNEKSEPVNEFTFFIHSNYASQILTVQADDIQSAECGAKMYLPTLLALKGEAQRCAQTQRVPRVAERRLARSPP